MSDSVQLSLIPDLVPEGAAVSQKTTAKTVVPKPQKIKPIGQGDCVETPSGDRGVVMLVNPLGDCYVEVKGKPFIYLASDLSRLPVSIISPSLTLRQIYIELHAYRTAIAQAIDEDTKTQLQQALELREKFFQVLSRSTVQLEESDRDDSR